MVKVAGMTYLFASWTSCLFRRHTVGGKDGVAVETQHAR